MNYKCAKNLEYCAFIYNGKPESVEFLKDHGVAIFDNQGGRDIGVLFADVSTLVSRNGGTFFDKGMIIVHTSEICQEGIDRYSDTNSQSESDKWRDIAILRAKQVIELQEHISHKD